MMYYLSSTRNEKKIYHNLPRGGCQVKIPRRQPPKSGEPGPGGCHHKNEPVRHTRLLCQKKRFCHTAAAITFSVFDLVLHPANNQISNYGHSSQSKPWDKRIPGRPPGPGPPREYTRSCGISSPGARLPGRCRCSLNVPDRKSVV